MSKKFLIVLLLGQVEPIFGDCTIDRERITKESPIILKESFNDFRNLIEAIYLPERDNDDKIVIRNNTNVYLACPGSKIKLNDNALSRFTCRNKKFNNYSFNVIKCEKMPESSLERQGNVFRIGFKIGIKFLTQIEGGFDQNKLITIYTSHLLTNTIKSFKVISPHGSFFEPYFTNCAKCYVQANQKNAITALFKGSDQVTVRRYFEPGRKYLAKGHLAPHVDFSFPYQQKATYYYYNCVPQWQQINNGGNWLKLENAIRVFVARIKRPFKIYTGIQGNSQFFGTNLYLKAEGNHKTIPVPRFMWKILQDPIDYKAVAFVVSNNPYSYTESANFSCTDVCSTMRWTHGIDIDGTNCMNSYEKGCLYCCKVDDQLRRMIPDLPIGNAVLL